MDSPGPNDPVGVAELWFGDKEASNAHAAKLGPDGFEKLAEPAQPLIAEQELIVIP